MRQFVDNILNELEANGLPVALLKSVDIRVSNRVPNAGASKNVVVINPTLRNKDPLFALFVIAHELMHIYYLHSYIDLTNMEPELVVASNILFDYFVNNVIAHVYKIEVPEVIRKTRIMDMFGDGWKKQEMLDNKLMLKVAKYLLTTGQIDPPRDYVEIAQNLRNSSVDIHKLPSLLNRPVVEKEEDFKSLLGV